MIYTELLQNIRHGIVNEAVPEKLLDLYKEMTKTTQWIVCIYFLKMPRNRCNLQCTSELYFL